LARVCLILTCSFLTAQVKAEKLTVVTEELPPYQYINKDGQLDGFTIEVVKTLFTITQDTPEIIMMPWARSYSTARSKKNVLIFSIAHTKERDEYFSWVGDLLDEEYYFWGLKANFENEITSIDSLKELRVTALRDSNEHEYLLKEHFLSIYPVVNNNQRILMLSHNRVDLLAGTELTLVNSAKQQGFDFSKLKKIFPITELNSQLCIAFNINSDKDLISEYKAAFRTIKASGQLNALRKKWQIPEKAIKD